MKFRKTSALAAVLSMFTIGFAYAGDGESCEKHGHGMKSSDANNDGKVSYDEFKAAHEQRMEKHFKRVDANSDGFIDATEKQAARDKMREHFQKHKEKMQQEPDDKTS